MKTFTYRNELYIRCIPGKNLFKSTMVHEVVNRGDIFAVRVSDQMLTIIPGNAEVVHSDGDIYTGPIGELTVCGNLAPGLYNVKTSPSQFP